MRVLACLPTYGVGTPYVESFGSILRRTAEAYDVGFTHVVSLLGRVADRKTRAIYRGYLHGSNFHGWLPVTQTLVTSLERLTGRSGYAGHTLLKLGGIFSVNSGGFFAPTGRFCPICLDPEQGVEYELLAHSFVDIARCPLHGATLLRACLACGSPRSIRSEGPQQRNCRRCNDDLWTQRAEAPMLTPEASWREAQVLRLISYCSDESQPAPAANWADRLRDGHAVLGRTRDKIYSKAERKLFFSMIYGGTRFRPRTLFHFAAVQSVDVVDLLLQPEACCSPRLPDLSSVQKRTTPRCARSHKVEAAKATLEALMQTDDTQLLRGLLPVCREHGLNASALFQKCPELYRTYGVERKRRQMLRVSRMAAESADLARRILGDGASSGITVRELGKRISQANGATKHVAEEAARDVLRELRAQAGASND